MKYFLDTEFYESGHAAPIELISIGIVDLDGREFYAENSAVDLTKVSPWLKEHVVPHLTGEKMTRAEIRESLLRFVQPEKHPEFWAWYADYDWVVFCQIFGRMIDLPPGMPMFCRDLRQYIDDVGVARSSLPAQVGVEHNAIADARWVRDAWKFARRQ